MGQKMAWLELGGTRLCGHSLAGEETCIIAPEMNVAFDVGRAPRELIPIDHVFLSHGHMDHSAGLVYYLSQREFVGNAPGTLYVPEMLVAPVRQLLQVWSRIDGHLPPGHIEPAIPGQDIAVRRNLVVRPFFVNHDCRRQDGAVLRSLGFSAIETRQKLNDDLVGLPQQRLIELKARGQEITHRVEIPLVTYCGDTAAGDFLDLAHVRETRILLLECTFIDPDHVGRARAGNHMHAVDLPDVLRGLNCEWIVLTHLSRRSGLREARAALRRMLKPAELERVRFLMEFAGRRRDSSEGPHDQLSAAKDSPAAQPTG